MSSTALYYPYLSIQDANWLKAALLFWEDGVHRIAPYPDLTDLESASSEIRLAADAGLIHSLSPFDVMDQAETDFLQRFPRILQTDRRLAIGNNMERLAGSLLRREDWILKEKMTMSLRHRLIHVGAMQQVSEDVFRMDSRYLLTYMCVLGNLLAKKYKKPLVAEETTLREIQLAANAIGKKVRGPRVDRFSVLARMNIAFPATKSLAHVPMGDVIHFNRQNRKTIAAFREHTASRLKDIISTPTGDLDKEIKDFQQDLNDLVRDYQLEMRALSQRTWLGVLSVAIPLASTVIQHLTAGGWNWDRAADGVGIAATVALERRQTLQRLRSSPASYVIALQRLQQFRYVRRFH